MRHKKTIAISMMLIVLILLPLTGFILLQWPQLVLRPGFLRWGAKRYLGHPAQISWSSFSPRVTDHGFLNKAITLEFDNLCLDRKPVIEKLCFKRSNLNFRYARQGLKVRLLEIGPMDFLKGEATIIASNSNTKKRNFGVNEIPIPKGTLPSWISKTKMHPLSIEMNSVVVKHPKATYDGGLILQTKVDTDQRLTGLMIAGNLRQADLNQKLNWGFELRSTSHFLQSDWTFKGEIETEIVKSLKTKLIVDLKKERAKQIQFTSDLDFQKGQSAVKIHAAGVINPKRLSTTISGTAINLEPSFPEIKMNHCTLVHQKTKTNNRGSSQIHCPIAATLAKNYFPKDLKGLYDIPKNLQMIVESDIDGFFIPDAEEAIHMETRISMAPFIQNFINTKANVNIISDGSLKKAFAKWDHQSKFDLDLQLSAFAKFVTALQHTRYAIPAPFHVFDGQVLIQTQGALASYKNLNRVPLTLSTKLISQEQKMDVLGEGHISLVTRANSLKAVEIDLDLLLNDVRLGLPTLDIVNLPRLGEDPRVKQSRKPPADPKKQADAISWRYRVGIKTANKPVRIASNIAVNDIPVVLDLEATPEKTSGFIQSQGAILELFRRKALVEEFQIQLVQPMGQSPVKGRFKVQYPDYTVWIVLSGTMKTPAVRFESDPPLSHDDIIAVLIYGEPLTQLEENEVANVGGISHAVSDRAIALASLYVLSATPIQRVNYNPQTKVFSAKVKIAAGTSLILGSDTVENHYVGIRQRLGKGWFLNTTVNNEQTGKTPTGSATLEWHKRY